MRMRAKVCALSVTAAAALGVGSVGCGGTECPEGWEAAELRCYATAETASGFKSEVGTGFFGYGAFGERTSDDDEPCAWEPTDLADGEGFDILVSNDAGEPLETLRVRVEPDGTWALTVVPGRVYQLEVESTLREPTRIEEGTVLEVAVFFQTGC